MTERKWLRCASHDEMLRFLKDRRSTRKWQLFAVGCTRLVWPSLSEHRQRFMSILEEEADHPGTWHALGHTTAGPWKYDDALRCVWELVNTEHLRSKTALADVAREIFGNPFRPVARTPSWLTCEVFTLASQMYETRDFSPMPILADALQEAGCDNDDILNHCRGPGPHVRGCHVIDYILGKG